MGKAIEFIGGFLITLIGGLFLWANLSKQPYDIGWVVVYSIVALVGILQIIHSMFGSRENG